MIYKLFNLFYSRVRDRAMKELAFTSQIQFLLMVNSTQDLVVGVENGTSTFTSMNTVKALQTILSTLNFLCKIKVVNQRLNSFRIWIILSINRSDLSIIFTVKNKKWLDRMPSSELVWSPILKYRTGPKQWK